MLTLGNFGASNCINRGNWLIVEPQHRSYREIESERAILGFVSLSRSCRFAEENTEKTTRAISRRIEEDEGPIRRGGDRILTRSRSKREEDEGQIPSG